MLSFLVIMALLTRIRIALYLWLLAVASADLSAADKWGQVYTSIFLTSDYRFDGVSFTGHKPTAQLSLYWWRPDNFYGGLWISGIDFRELGDPTTSYMAVAYGGRNMDVGRTRLSAEGMYSFFPDKRIPGPTYNFVTVSAKLQRSIGRYTLTAIGGWTPQASYGSGRSWRFSGEASHNWTNWLSLSGKIGQRRFQRGMDRIFWDAGVTAKWKKASVDLRYYDTNLTFAQCGFVDWCQPGVAVTLQLDLWH